ncbi:glycosyltransferase family 4 protein [Sphaerisporangium perillae]|uniref:glycosyltransferase family 4 protein n=1 Tax=Sphaerisporangium perillae TaxID=2935860 RepID=UPI00200E2AB9|nr:glycosyltransferase family 4 protein [Sphaerisporangium perillae]
MKIRYLLMNAYGVGGTIRTVMNQAGAMAGDHDVELVSVFRTRDEPKFPLDPRIRLHALIDLRGPRWRHPARTWFHNRPSRLVPPSEVRYAAFSRLSDRKIVRYLQSLHGGVLVTTRPALNLLAARFARPGIVRVAQEHMHLRSHKPELAAEIVRWYPNMDAVVTLTYTDAAEYMAALDGGGARVATIPNALSPAERAPATRNSKTIIAAGRLTRQKGFDLLIEAFASVAGTHPDWQLRIYGDGKERGELQRLIHRLHLYNHVYLMGGTTTLEKELPKGAMFVLSSRAEGFGMVLTEAMAHGLPVVSFDCPNGPAEIISHEQDGLLVPPGDLAGLAAAIERLIIDTEQRHALGTSALASAQRYDMSWIRPQWEQLFTELRNSQTREPHLE